jgi:DNA-binding NtrC family response regulator
MAAIPRDLVESELFGHEKGAFTGANTRASGRFEQAEGGTLFLDEIGDMPMEAQTRLLRVLQQGEYTTVGGRTPIKTDVRIVAASNKDLRVLIQQGLFREDLFFRLNVVPLRLPPLRERAEDVPDLMRHFFALAEREGLPPKQVDAAALERLKRYRWPGNVRELENTIHRAVLLTTGPEIGVDGILTPDGTRLDQARGSGAVAHATLAAEQMTRSLVGRTVADVERDLILETLKHCLGNRTHAANILGISIRTLRNKLNEYSADGVPVPPPGGGEIRGAA